ncbi:MAG: response regulator, partial [Chloroflexi bacterium]|nr:response regulator [Chloroflexota bacterium]
MARRILVVDDNVESVKLIGLMLESRGYEIVAAVSGAQALSKALSDEPDLIILDVMMPDMDGYEVCRRLRADPNTASLPVIMLTARTQISDKVAGFQAGVDDYLTKPIHPEELASRVAAVLQRTTNSDATIPSRRAKVIGFVGAKGGVGTTSVAINVGASLVTGQARDKRAVLAEMRSGLAAAGLFLGLRTDIGLSELLRRPLENTDGEAIDSQLQGHRSGLFVLCGQVEPPGV